MLAKELARARFALHALALAFVDFVHARVEHLVRELEILERELRELGLLELW